MEKSHVTVKKENRLSVGWFVGKQKWAYQNLSSHIIKKLPQYNHKINDVGDINIIMSADQFDDPKLFGKNGILKYKKIIFHIDGNRWYEKNLKP